MRESQQSACRVENAIISRLYETIRDANNNTIFFIYRNTDFECVKYCRLYWCDVAFMRYGRQQVHWQLL
jgi:hypothetical protein